MNIPTIMTSDGRRAWSFAALVGGAIVFTIFAAYGVYSVRNNTGFTFWLALAAHAQVFVVLTALAAQLVKRTISIGKDGATVKDHGEIDE